MLEVDAACVFYMSVLSYVREGERAREELKLKWGMAGLVPNVYTYLYDSDGR